MKKLVPAAILIAMLLVTLSVSAQTPEQRYVVVFKRSDVPKTAADIIEAAGGQLAKAFPQVGVAIATSNDPDFADLLREAKGIDSVGVDRFQMLPAAEVQAAEVGPQPADVLYADQWNIRRVNADLAWEVTSGSHDTVVAVIDSGIAYNHPDLAPNVIYNACYSVSSPCIPYPSYLEHGTQVAGTVAAAFGGGATVGVGPNLGLANYNVFELVPGFGLGVYAQAAWAAMLDAAEQGFDVIYIGLGTYRVRSDSPQDVAMWTAWNRAVDYIMRQGVTIVSHAGNFDIDLNGPVDRIPSGVTGIICTGATGIRPEPSYPQDDAYDVRAFYSNYGATVTLAAPGGDLGPDGTPYPFPAMDYAILVTSVDPDPVCAATASCPVGYGWEISAGLEASHVAGVAGLVKDVHPRLNPHQVTSILKETAEDLGDRQQFGHGMVDAYGAVTYELDD